MDLTFVYNTCTTLRTISIRWRFASVNVESTSVDVSLTILWKEPINTGIINSVNIFSLLEPCKSYFFFFWIPRDLWIASLDRDAFSRRIERRRETVKVPPGPARHVDLRCRDRNMSGMSSSHVSGGRSGEIESQRPVKNGGHVRFPRLLLPLRRPEDCRRGKTLLHRGLDYRVAAAAQQTYVSNDILAAVRSFLHVDTNSRHATGRRSLAKPARWNNFFRIVLESRWRFLYPHQYHPGASLVRMSSTRSPLLVGWWSPPY